VRDDLIIKVQILQIWQQLSKQEKEQAHKNHNKYGEV
jgi:hypothetical protein